ncbi:glycyl-tRNA synthetase (glyS) [Archaeoglobus fulgidus DSM 4304]|uniref:Glycine--tRNA ligase n=2 Tax=Archaeoglobus fulgidus TaxID=2234 RepID=SYG_ARCFU|nr:RecName: Full=Glycine--tRNA ligase; AltName: Full=Glycyl-tRNA synthetase; Short=GlyRS [Archaeoglobus fulgidus DSM 4304]AAB90321.1 glycyl-tRNA synthetase (glyS) [Archaeoglobus fulgidus DSM 4304]
MHMSEIMEMLIRRGFLWQSFEIYGGMAGFIDYAPLGNNLRRKIENIWRKYFVINERAAEIDTPTIGIEEVFIASGHATSFTDVAIECENCGRVYRADHYVKEKLGIEVDETVEAVKEVMEVYDLKCECGGRFKDPAPMNLMFSTTIGPGKGKKGYLRPETAQGMFVDFKRLANFFREKLPFGVAQIGRAYRNEISPRQGVIRLREFNQAELEFFVHPGEKKHPHFSLYAKDVVKLVDKFDSQHEITLEEAVEKGIIANQILAYFIGKTRRFLLEIGIKDEKLRFRQHKDVERAHYATDCWDAEVLTSYGWIEVVGIADRTNYDLKRHSKFSGEDLSVFVPYEEPVKVKRRKIVPILSKLGPEFRQKAKKVAEALEALNVEADLDEVEVEVDGEKVKVTKEFFEIQEVEEEVTGEKVIPHVIEPSFGLDRITYSVLEHAFDKDVVDGEERRVLRLKRWVSPIEVAVLPLLSREPFESKGMEIVQMLREEGIFTDYDDSGSIGRRYRRFDEIGTPFCVTVDHQTFEDETVTIRDRDTTAQVRVKLGELPSILKELLRSEKDITEFGEVFRQV